MIPRSERLFFNNLNGSPPHGISSKPQVTPIAMTVTATSARFNHKSNGTGRSANTANKHLQETVPAAPWRPRINSGKDTVTQDEQPSPLDRKVPTTIMSLKLGSRPMDTGVLSSAPTSATLAPGSEKENSVKIEEKCAANACRRENCVTAGRNMDPKEEMQSEQPGNFRRMPRTHLAMKSGDDLAYAEPPTRFERPSDNLLYHSSLSLSEPHYPSSPRRTDSFQAMDMNNETNIYVNGLPEDDMAKKAIAWLTSHGFSSSFAKESFSARLRRMADSTSSNVYLSNLPLKFTPHQLEQLFNPHPVASLKILHDVHGESRGVGFVRLYDRATAKECIERLHGRILPGTTLPLQVRFADSEAQKHLKHSVSQKHTLESLGLLSKLDEAVVRYYQGVDGATPMRIRTASELDAAVGRVPVYTASDASPPYPQPLTPSADAAFMSVHAGRSAFENGANGLGIEISEQRSAMWPHSQRADASSLTSLATSAPHFAYSKSLNRVLIPHHQAYFPVTPVLTGDPLLHDSRDNAGYLAVPLLPPFTYVERAVSPAHSTPLLVHACKDDGSDKAVGNAQHSRDKHRRNKKPIRAAGRARFPGLSTDRVVSDPLALLSAQQRVREALGMKDRVRAAVSADNSVVGVDGPATSSATDGEEDGAEELDADESLSVEFQT
ncbi:uncharacterized protein MEPE_05997 [Melanopsichium pennsylvanicum]|uniref:RRM domain-containing protein n=1 Tax=Melanopsichium pennsylvanicum TaxID=63383 RepID=A0AAJ5C7T8_9BASI|nr:uncharacterized protein MEPE_05997 [Melanopsichium pennsylvanicum]